MKKLISFLLFASLAFFCFAQNNEKYYSIITDPMTYSKIFVTPDCVYEDDEEMCTPLKKYPHDAVKLGEDGYFYVNVGYLQNQIVIFKNNGMSLFFDPAKKNDKNPEYFDYWISNNQFHGSFLSPKYKASSVLTENLKSGKVIYQPENLGKALFPPDGKESFPGWNYEHIPYVEGQKGYGEGEKITISTKERFLSLLVLNGYVSVSNLSLYKKNSRVKTFIVKDLDNKTEYEVELEDAVMFQEIYFEEPTANVELIIKDVYKGDKYDDTCISALIPVEQGAAEPFNYKKQTQNHHTEEIKKEISKLLQRQ